MIPSSPASVIDDLHSAFSCQFCDDRRYKPVCRSFITNRGYSLSGSPDPLSFAVQADSFSQRNRLDGDKGREM